MAHHVDKHVGQKIRDLRNERGMSQTDVARKLKLSFQQVQKYELGTNRVAASRLFEIAEIFQVPVKTFFPEQEVADAV